MPSLIAVLGLNTTPFKTQLNDAGLMARRAGSSISEHLSGKLMQFASVAGVEEMIRRVVELGSHIHDTSLRLGISTDAVQAWDYALKLSGSSIDQAATFFERLATNRQKAMQGSQPQIDAFKNLGVSLQELKDLRTEDIALKIAATFETGDPQKLIADLRTVGGRGAGELAAAFRDGLSELVNGAKDAGVVMSEALIYQMEETSDRAKTIWMQFVAGIAPAVGFLIKMVGGLWEGLNIATRGVVGFVSGAVTGTGAMKGASDLVKEYEDEVKAAEKAQEDRRKKMTKPLFGGEEDAENKKVAREAERHAKEILKLKEDLFKKQDKNDMDALSREGQLLELAKRRAMIIGLMKSGELGEVGMLKAAEDVEDIDAETRKLMIKTDRAEKAPKVHQDLSSLQKIGGLFVSPIENIQIDLQRKMESHLRKLVEQGHGQTTGWHGSKH